MGFGVRDKKDEDDIGVREMECEKGFGLLRRWV